MIAPGDDEEPTTNLHSKQPSWSRLAARGPARLAPKPARKVDCRSRRLRVLCDSKITEGLSMVLVLVYSVVIVAELALDDAILDDYSTEIWAADLAFLITFLVEIVLKLGAYGFTAYFSSTWNLVDAVVIVVSIVFAILEGTFKSVVLLRLLRLRVLTRLFRLFVMIERLIHRLSNRNKTTRHARRASALVSPVEQCMSIIHALVEGAGEISAEHKDELDRVLQLLAGGDLYQPFVPQADPDAQQTAALDVETVAWMNEELAAQGANERRMLARPTAYGSFGVTASFDDDAFDVLTPDAAPNTVNGSRRVRAASVSPASVMKVGGAGGRLQSQLHLLEFMSQHTLMGETEVPEPQAPEQQQQQSQQEQPPVAGAAETPVSVVARQGLTRGAAWLWGLALRTARLRKLLKQVSSWTCNIFTVHQITKGHPLYVVSYNLLVLHAVPEKLGLDIPKLQRMLLRIEAGYNPLPYHNASHAADVVQTMHYFMSQPLLAPYMTPLHVLAGILAAATHDYAHPGVNNAFEIATRSELAVRYNDIAVLESMHVSSFFSLLSMDELNFMASSHVEDYKKFRGIVVPLVLATDMAKHFEDIAKLKAKFAQVSVHTDASPSSFIATVADTTFFMAMSMHTADVSNPAKPLVIYRQWVTRVVEEFYDQGDQERERGLPISTFYDRYNPNLPKLQLGFIDFIVAPLYMEWSKAMKDMAETVMPLLSVNRIYWDKQLQLAQQQQRRASTVAVTIQGPPPAARRTSSTVAS